MLVPVKLTKPHGKLEEGQVALLQRAAADKVIAEGKGFELFRVKFLKGVGLWNAGELAGFKKSEAQAYVDAKLAVFCDDQGQLLGVENGVDGSGQVP